MKKISCNIICDLIPLVKDRVASRESEDMVKDHIEDCEACREEFETFESIDLADLSLEDEKIIHSIKRNVFITQMTILILGAIIGVALTGSMGQFYNFIIMPIMGGISLIALKDRWYMGFIGVFVLSYLGQIIYFMVTDEFSWEILYGAMFYGIIYISLMALGMIIFILIRFAFGKGSDRYEKE